MSRERALELLKEGQSFLITCHRRPDADALGSALGLAAIFRALGKDVLVWVPEPLALNLQFLAGSEPVDTIPEGARYDATWVMDTAAKALLPRGLPGQDVRGPLVVIDHHAAHDDVGDVVVRDIEACATGEVVMDLAEELELRPVPEAAATPLYAAIVADTGGFRYGTTRPKTLRLGAELLERGADPWVTAYELFEGWPQERLALLGAILETLEMDCDGQLAVLRVTRAMLERHGADDDMVEGMVNYGRMLRGVEVALLLWEYPSDDGQRIETKVSLRSSGDVDVSKVAVALNGGGHRAAAGAQVDASLEETEAKARGVIRDLLAG
ncbi:MAG TPA: DHH family phosphoesterase [Polyangiaceae bacterium LLY-WYZ-15_(1-7)]|nr:phosphoesterase [Sandaracinus sp.]HJL03451.1 DHH family phosphoesterase [Polyangiaceae bacterium LLY-WYZ-15_(1-7)]MBJ74960.1 phosphoesterase [Sandaracinus sp.]HJL09566.1 DHH family phosphoesterase [Polyangiaceae bacterium LLY-WYZ-15_(1-7)]HJL22068.1 DHH family phosphoesterase [Polyangiaceae bacterium LLY-WYZ-15_(1-7)]